MGRQFTHSYMHQIPENGMYIYTTVQRKQPVNAQGLQSEELMKAIADSTRSYEDILRCIKGEASEEG